MSAMKTELAHVTSIDRNHVHSADEYVYSKTPHEPCSDNIKFGLLKEHEMPWRIQ